MANSDAHKEIGFHFSAWLADSDLRRYLLHFSDAQWLRVAQCTLLLGLGYLEFHNVQIPSSSSSSTSSSSSEDCCSPSERRTFCRAFEQLVATRSPDENGQKTDRSKAFVVIPAQCQAFPRSGEPAGSGGAVRQPSRGSQQGRPYQCNAAKGKKAQKQQPAGASIERASHEEAVFPGAYAAYLALRRFLMIFAEFHWPAVLKKLFVLGLRYLDFLGVPLHMLGLSELRAIAYEYGGPVPGDSVARRCVRNRVRRLLPAATANAGLVAAKDLHTDAQRVSNRRGRIRLRRTPRLLKIQEVFPFQWVTPSWIDGEARAQGAEKASPAARYPSWWSPVMSEETPFDTPLKRLEKSGDPTKKGSKGRASRGGGNRAKLEKLPAPGPRTAEGWRAVTLLPFQTTAGLCVVRHTVAIGTSICTQKAVKPHRLRPRGCRIYLRESSAKPGTVQNERRRRLLKFPSEKKRTQLCVEKDVFYVNFTADPVQRKVANAEKEQQDSGRDINSASVMADRLTSPLASPQKEETAKSLQRKCSLVSSGQGVSSEKATLLGVPRRGGSVCEGTAIGICERNGVNDARTKNCSEKKRQALGGSSGESSTREVALESNPSPGRMWRESLRRSTDPSGGGGAEGNNNSRQGAAAVAENASHHTRENRPEKKENTGEAPTRSVRKAATNLFGSCQKLKKQSIVDPYKPALPLHIVAHTEKRWQQHLF